MIYGDAHALVYSRHQNGGVSSSKFVSHHDLTCVAISPVDVVLEDSYTVGLLKNLQKQKLIVTLCSFYWNIRKLLNMIYVLT